MHRSIFSGELLFHLPFFWLAPLWCSPQIQSIYTYFIHIKKLMDLVLIGFPAFVTIVVILPIHPGLKYSHKTAFLVFRSGPFMRGSCILSQTFKLITWLDCISSLYRDVLLEQGNHSFFFLIIFFPYCYNIPIIIIFPFQFWNICYVNF